MKTASHYPPVTVCRDRVAAIRAAGTPTPARTPIAPPIAPPVALHASSGHVCDTTPCLHGVQGGAR